ncbi:MAG: type II toxin-antitoxin system PemK/MazF family toxin [Actinobacteria bacterium]|nr:type II toxin-antitoxin system PemK/MazF family toxin [Actinomycetota bacterium]
MVKRGDIVWADLGDTAGRRPVCIVTRDAAIEVLAAVTCAPITRTIRARALPTELHPLGSVMILNLSMPYFVAVGANR